MCHRLYEYALAERSLAHFFVHYIVKLHTAAWKHPERLSSAFKVHIQQNVNIEYIVISLGAD